MNGKIHGFRVSRGCHIWLMMVWLACVSSVFAQNRNPISRFARVVNPELAAMEDRQSWLEERTRTMARLTKHPLRTAIGARGFRPFPEAPDPYVVIDLGSEHILSRIFLVPSQHESVRGAGIFPVQFTLEVSSDPDFREAHLVDTTGRIDFPNPLGRPIPFTVSEVPARFVRLTVHRGHNNHGWLDKFGLSEIVVMSGDDVVSFGAEVTMSNSLTSGINWYPGALTDGRMPHGIWHSGVASEDPGDLITVDSEEQQVVEWVVELDKTVPVDRVVLFPYSLTSSMDAYVISDLISLETWCPDCEDWTVVSEWRNRPSGASCSTPVVFVTGGWEIRKLRLVSKEPWVLGDMKLHGLSEIEVWSGGRNVARDLPVTRFFNGDSLMLLTLTNGFSGNHLISNIGIWLNQLHERVRYESELADLQTRITSAEAETELNVTFGAAVFFGLVFMIPVVLFENRRVKAKKRVEMMRKRIASDLHDDVGGNLGSISLIARSARKGLEKIAAPKDFTEDLHEVELIARESSLAMRDIVWLVEQRDDSVGDLVARMRETGARMLREVEYSLECRSKRADSRLSMDFKRHFFLFFKEALHNILKHSRASHVSILIDDHGDELLLEIHDDGIGMPQEVADDPETSRKLRQRAELLGGNIAITSSVNKGTRVRLTIHVKKLNTLSPTQ